MTLVLLFTFFNLWIFLIFIGVFFLPPVFSLCVQH